jgi:hypothetical protein
VSQGHKNVGGAEGDLGSCPDEGSGCLTQSAVGGQCQKDRDGKFSSRIIGSVGGILLGG